ncbi:MAG: hypothetical protein ACJ77A_14165 [Actinomycetota bacterium]
MSAPRPLSPYKGLMPYQEQDSRFFFGRDSEREIVAANLLASRLTVVYGVSGVGKSSLLNAAVLPALKRKAGGNEEGDGPPEFAVALANTWQEDPASIIRRAVSDAVAMDMPGRFTEDSQPRGPLGQALQEWTERLGSDLLIILDQFEEYFQYQPEVDPFVSEFAGAVGRPDLRANFLVSIREDALARLDRFKGGLPQLFENYLRIEHLERQAARDAITDPVHQYNQMVTKGLRVGVDEDLVGAVLDELQTGHVALVEEEAASARSRLPPSPARARIEAPYLQLVMTRIWGEEAHLGSRALRRGTLAALGGAERIVRTHLDERMEALPLPERDVAAGIFNYLVTPSGSKMAHTAIDLAKYTGLSETSVAEVISKLSAPDVRLLRPIAPPFDRQAEARCEVFHDVLAAPVLDWRRRHLLAREEARRKRRTARLAVAFGTAVLLLLGAIGAIVLRQAHHVRSLNVVASRLHSQITGARSQLPFLLFTSDRNGSIQIYRMLTDGSEQTQLTHRRGDFRDPAISPDRRRVLFAGGVRGSDVFVMNVDGSEVRALTHNGASDNPEWSPDCQSIVFRRTVAGNTDIWVMSADGRGQINLTKSSAVTEGDPAWSPDGQRIAFRAAAGDRSQIWVMNQSGGGLRTITHGRRLDFGPSWSPDGSEIVFRGSIGDNSDIYLVSLTDGAVSNLTKSPNADDIAPAWSPDGAVVAFSSDQTGKYDIYTMSAEGSVPRLLADSGGRDSSPQFSLRTDTCSAS